MASKATAIKTSGIKAPSTKTSATNASRSKSEAVRAPADTTQDPEIVETAEEARGAEPGPSVLALLTISTVAAVFVLGIVWFIFFRT